MVALKGSEQCVLSQSGFKAVITMQGVHADLRETLLLHTNETLDTSGLEILRK